MSGQISREACKRTVSMRAASADRAAGPRMARGSMRHEHTTSLARCEIARDEPDAHPGQTCSAHRLAVTSRSLTTAADLSVPFARAVVLVRRRGLDHDMKRDELHVNMSWSTQGLLGVVIGPNARPQTVPIVFTLCGRDVHRSFFPRTPPINLVPFTSLSVVR